VATVHTTDEFTAWIEELAVPHRAKRAFWHLVISGPDALAATRQGLAHSSPQVRDHCARVLDHLADQYAFDDLLAVLDDPDPRVRRDALHALACDRCKDNACRPDHRLVLPKATELLLGDPSKHVRAGAAEVVARWVHTDPEAQAALITARDRDPDPSVRKKAGWYAPGGPIHRKTRPTLGRM
jgi:HEAT repeat protein